MSVLRFTPLAILAAAPALAQGLETTLVSDTIGDTIWMCTDENADGDYNDAGELFEFYNDAVGPISMTNNVGMLRADSGEVYITDTSEDTVLRLVDLNDDGDAHDAGEAKVWFDGTSGGPNGILLSAARGMWLDPDGTLFVATSNTNAGGTDAIVRLKDLNGDGDAMEFDESSIFFERPGGAVTDSFPTAVARGVDGALYYLETGSTGGLQKGVYRLDDANQSGDIDNPSEVTPYFIVPTTSGNPFFWDLAIDNDGRFYTADTGNDFIWRFFDSNGDGTIDAQTEASIVYTSPGQSLVWEIAPSSDGSLYIAEDQNPDRLVRLVDVDGNGSFGGPGEYSEIYLETIASTDLGSPKAIAIVGRGAPLSLALECSPSQPNSSGLSAQMLAFGTPVASMNDVTLVARHLPPFQFGFFISSRTSGNLIQVTGSEGILCLSGDIGRYSLPGEILNAGGNGEFELQLDTGALRLPNSAVPAFAGDTWHFQAWFRDFTSMGANTSNFTDAIEILFL